MSRGSVAPTVKTLHTFLDTIAPAGPLSFDRFSGKRSRPRRTLIVPVHVRVLSKSGRDDGHICKLRDVTDWGLGLRSQVPYRVGQRVSVDLQVNNATWCGDMQVVHCTQTVGGYKIGLVLCEHAEKQPRRANRTAAFDPDTAEDPTTPLRKALRQREWLAQARAEVGEAMRAYELARRSWGILGTSVRKEIRKLVSSLPHSAQMAKDSRRRHPRARSGADVRVIFCANGTWRRVLARIADVSENGVGLMLPHDLNGDEAEHDSAGPCRAHAGMTMILGIGTGANTLWVPAEIIHCQAPDAGTVRVGAKFLTPRSLGSITSQ